MTYWHNKHVIVTGGGGFLGRHLVAQLNAHGAAHIIAPRQADCDLRDIDAVRRLLAQSSRTQNSAAPKPIDIVIHLAAHVGGIGANQAHPAEFFYDNLIMGTQLLHESWRAGIPKFVAVGTVCAYPKFAPVPFREDDLWLGYPEETNAPYGLAKKMLLVQAQAYRRQYGYDAIFLLPANLYGPGDSFDLENGHVIPMLIRKFLESQQRAADPSEAEVVVWGTGRPTREFLYVEDAARGILLAAEHYDSPEPVNLGSGIEISIRELVDIIARLTGFRGRIIWDATHPDGQPRRKLDTSRAERSFGFRSTTTFEDGLTRTIAAFRTQLQNA